MSNYKPLPIYVMPDGRRTVSSLDLAAAIMLSSGKAMRHDNLLSSCDAIAEGPCVEAAGAVVPGLYRDIANRPRKMAYLGQQALAALAVYMRGESGLIMREFSDAWREPLIVGCMPEIKLHKRLRAIRKPTAAETQRRALTAPAALPAPVAAVSDGTAELLRELRSTMSGWGLSPTAQQSYVAAIFKERGITLPEPAVQPAESTTQIAERIGWPVFHLANLPGFQELKRNPVFGESRLTMAPSGRQVPTHAWFPAGVAEIEALVLRSSNGR